MRILITGATGMVGSAFGHLYPKRDLIKCPRAYDLRDPQHAQRVMQDTHPDAIIHLAAKVGGVKANMEYLGEFYRDNILINTNVLEAARKFKVKKVVSLLSTCIYPDNIEYPLTENKIHHGPPHPSNYAYAYAKRMIDVQSRAYRAQYGCNFISAISNNLFGEHDNFDLENSHVLPAIIRKVYEAKLNSTCVSLWGDGAPLREFTYSRDLAEILLFLLDNYNEPSPINVGNTSEISIKEAAEIICEIMDFKGEIIWDITKPKGQHRKPSDNSKLLELGWRKENYTNFKKALTKTCKWFIINYSNIRGMK